MLKTLDRYILKKFLLTFFFTALIFTMIAMVIDFSEKVEKFIEEPITSREIIFDYYPGFMLYISGLLWHLYALIQVIFFTSRMAANAEIIAILNAGVSYPRFLYPYFLGASVIVIMSIIGNHFLIPEGNKKMLRINYTYISKNQDKGKTQNVHFFVAPDTKVYIQSYRKRDTTIIGFRLEHFEGNRLVSLLKANSARWIAASGKWQLEDYQIRTFEGSKENIFLSKNEKLDTLLSLTPEDFVEYKEQYSMMTSPELARYIRKQQARGAGNVQKYQVELYRRTADAFAVFILTIIGVSVASRKVRGGLGLHLALGITMGAIFVFLSKFSIVFASGDTVPPLLGIWMPNIVFAAIAIYLVAKAQK